MDNEFEYDLDLNDISPDKSTNTICSLSKINNASAMIVYNNNVSDKLELEFNNLDFAHYQCTAHPPLLLITH
ncbi:10984_t:CDS:2 [Funneliformis geosporum]|nr:10984_t:CDS:2 [Funneliformis geosporum]